MKLVLFFYCLTLIYSSIYCSSILSIRSILEDKSYILTSSQIIKAKRALAEKQTAPYGNIIGVASHNVVAYSNGNDSYISNETNSFFGVYMGMKWQCVEYVRRWTFFRRGATFGNVDSASDIWNNLTYVERVVDKKKFSLKQYPNGSPHRPTVGSYLIYPVQKDMPFGHAAVIVGFGPHAIHVAEQNFDFHYWTDYYAREIPLVHRDGLYYVEDTYNIYGWMDIADETHQLKPLDEQTAAKIEGKSGSNSASIRTYSSLVLILIFSFNFMFY